MGSIPIARSNSPKGLVGPDAAPEPGASAEFPRNLFPGRSGQDKPPTQKGVREQPVATTRHQASSKGLNGPAHPSNRVVAQLNAKWRVVDDPLQWILQRKKGSPRSRNAGWQGRSFCRAREALLRCVHEYCGEVDLDALARLQDLPDWHPDWDHTNLDVHGTDHALGDRGSKPLRPKVSEVSDADE